MAVAVNKQARKKWTYKGRATKCITMARLRVISESVSSVSQSFPPVKPRLWSVWSGPPRSYDLAAGLSSGADDRPACMSTAHLPVGRFSRMLRQMSGS